MLTKNDLSQIQKIVQTETKKIVRGELSNYPTKADLANHPTKQDLARELSNHPTKQDLAKELKPLKDDIAHIRKDTKAIVGFFDREYLELRKRVERIEQHLNLSAA